MLLESAGVDVTVEASEVDERHEGEETPLNYVRRISREKARWVSEKHPEEKVSVIAADTIVVPDGRILGKPADTAEASRMLSQLSGRVHSVMTGVCVVDVRRRHTKQFVCETHVHFTELSEARIRRYVESGEPLDKAGAYGIQGHAAGFVSRIEGSYTNVVGLPLCETLAALENLGIYESLELNAS